MRNTGVDSRSCSDERSVQAVRSTESPRVVAVPRLAARASRAYREGLSESLWPCERALCAREQTSSGFPQGPAGYNVTARPSRSTRPFGVYNSADAALNTARQPRGFTARKNETPRFARHALRCSRVATLPLAKTRPLASLGVSLSPRSPSVHRPRRSRPRRAPVRSRGRPGPCSPSCRRRPRGAGA